jgi:hypothetical protein
MGTFSLFTLFFLLLLVIMLNLFFRLVYRINLLSTFMWTFLLFTMILIFRFSEGLLIIYSWLIMSLIFSRNVFFSLLNLMRVLMWCLIFWAFAFLRWFRFLFNSFWNCLLIFSVIMGFLSLRIILLLIIITLICLFILNFWLLILLSSFITKF